MKQATLLLCMVWVVLSLSAEDRSPNLLPSEKQSPNFEKVAQYLDLGGPVYGFLDVDGDVSRIVGQVQEMMALFKEETTKESEMPPWLASLDLEAVLDLLGVDNIQAIGLSSYKEGDIFRNKSFVLMEDGLQGLFRVMGGEPHLFGTWQMAPSGTDMVLEQDLNLKAFHDVALSFMERSMGPPGVQIFKGLMQQKPEGMDFTWKELITQLDTRVIAIIRMDPEGTLDVPLPVSPSPSGFEEPFKVEEDFDHDLQKDPTDAQPNTPPPASTGLEEVIDAPKPQTVTIPLVDFYFSLENLGWLVDKLAKEFENVQEIEPFSVNGWHGFGFAGQMPPGAKGYKPYLLHEKATGRLVLVSRPDFMTACLSNSGGIRKDLNFQKAVEGLPHSGNSFTYFSPDIVDAVGGIIIELAEGEEDAQKALPMALGMLGHLKKPQAAVYRNQDDGFLISANQVFSHKGNFFMAMLPNPLVMGAMWFTALKSESSMGPAFSIAPLDDGDASLKMRQLGLIYQEYLQETDGAHVPADTAGVHGWALEIANKTGFDDASIYRVDGDLSVEGHFGDLADSVRDKSFPGSPFSLTLVAGIPSDAKVENVPLAWTRGLQTNGRWVFDSPFRGQGGHVLFLDGRVEYFLEAIDEGALVDYKTGKPTLDITKAIPLTARVLEYAVPELDLPQAVPENSLPKVQVDLPALQIPEIVPQIITPEVLKSPPVPSDPDSPPSPALSVLEPKSVSEVLTQNPRLNDSRINPEFFARGKKLYSRPGACVTCHQPSGKGLTDIFPPLAGADWGLEPDDVVVRIVLNGLQGPTRVLGKDYGSVPFIPTIWREWSDTDIAAVITYTRNAWGNSGPVVSAETVKRIRSEVGTRGPWTVKELEVYQNKGVSSDEDTTRLPPILEPKAPELKPVGQVNEPESTKVPEPVPVGPDPEVASPPKPKLPPPPE